MEPRWAFLWMVEMLLRKFGKVLKGEGGGPFFGFLVGFKFCDVTKVNMQREH